MKKFLLFASIAVVFAACSNDVEEIEKAGSNITRIDAGDCPHGCPVKTIHYHCLHTECEYYMEKCFTAGSAASIHEEDVHHHGGNTVHEWYH